MVVLSLSKLPGVPPPAVEAPSLEKQDRLKVPAAVPSPMPSDRKVRTIPIYTGEALSAKRLAFSDTPAPIVEPSMPPPPVMPPAPIAKPTPSLPPPPAMPGATQPPAAKPDVRSAKPRSSRVTKPADRFTRFCRGRGPHSWMRFNGKKRYCK
jgi:hypothetical protein